MKLFKKLIFAAAFFGMLFIGASAEEIAEYPTGGMLSLKQYLLKFLPNKHRKTAYIFFPINLLKIILLNNV